jgi:hypothetical protein
MFSVGSTAQWEETASLDGTLHIFSQMALLLFEQVSKTVWKERLYKG